MRARDLSPDAHMTLDVLLAGLAAQPLPGVPVGGLASDSRRVRPGDLFLACRGLTHHGVAFAADAVAAGAVAIAWDSRGGAAPAVGGVPVIAIDGLGDRLGLIANRWYGKPSAQMRVSGVTGTNGKTTVAFLIADCLRRLGRSCGYVGTLGSGVGGLDREPGLTTPDCLELHARLSAFRSLGAGHAVLEVSSHALTQGRVGGIAFDSVMFTNLSRDHIDYHGDMSAYGAAKARLIVDTEARHRIVDVDDGFGRELAGRCDGDVVAVSTRPGKDVRRPPWLCMRAVRAEDAGTTVAVEGSWGSTGFMLPLAGHFNVANAALALAQLLCWETPLEDAAEALAGVSAPPGRMQRVLQAGGAPAPAVYVDFAHTPRGLEAALSALRSHCQGRLWCVFGCGGDRDPGKRAPMGEVATRLADRIVVTNDNPRHESPQAIIEAILEGIPAAKAAVIPDRAAAIAHAIAAAAEDDVVLIAGKGHETHQAIDGRRLPFSDYETARAALAGRGGEGGRR